MSRQLVSRSRDLQRLQDEGYDFTITPVGLVLVVPYATAQGTVAAGRLVSELQVDGDHAGVPPTHVISFVGAAEGELPCDAHGRPLEELINQHGPLPIGDGMVASCTFSRKPPAGYPDYYEKMTTYADLLYGHAQAIDRSVRLRTFPPVPADEDESVFRYFDSMTSRSRIGAVSDRLRGQRVAIIGLGGTGSYILDAVAKTPVAQIHVYDGDVMLTHNAFRAPGAASLEDLRAAPLKVDYHTRIYDQMRRGVIPHPRPLAEDNLEELRDLDFVFLSLDTGPIKRTIIEYLQAHQVPLVDCGMGIYQTGDHLGGIVRTTASNPAQPDPLWINTHISFADAEDDEYEQNIQIAELNMLNAALAVLMWKKHAGFYLDIERETSCLYTIDGNHLLNEGSPNED